MTLSGMSARGAETRHRWFWAAPLAAVLIATSCESNGPLFTTIDSSTPAVDAGQSPSGNDDPRPSTTGPNDDPGEGGGSGSSAGGSNGASGAGASTPGAAGSGGSGTAGQGGTTPDDPGGSDGSDGSAGAGGNDNGGAAAGEAGAGGVDSAGVVEPPPNDNSCGLVCLRRGGRCFEGTCYFDCEQPGSCRGEQIICPSGRPCEVRCGAGACENNVICSSFSQCNILCEGEGSCERQVICEGECNVTCSGRDSCASGIGGSVDLLELDCSGERSCAATVSCEGQDCRLTCSGPQSCARIRTLAVDNVVSCSGPGSCLGDFTCLGASCDYQCADDACQSGVDCRALNCDDSAD